MLSDEKILITGPAGRIASGLAETRSPADNEVWGIAGSAIRRSASGSRLSG